MKTSQTMNFTQFAPQIISTLMKEESYRDNDESVISSFVNDVLIRLSAYVPATNSKSKAAKSGGGSGSGSGSKRGTGPYPFFATLFGKKAVHREAVEELFGPVTLSESLEYSAPTASAIGNLSESDREELFTEWPTLSSAYDAIKKYTSLTGFSVNAFLWKNINDAQKESLKSFMSEHTEHDSGAAAVVAPKPKKAAAAKAATKRREGHNFIKTFLSEVYKLPETHPVQVLIKEFIEKQNLAKKDSNSVGVVIWKKLDQEHKDTWNELCADLSDRDQKIAAIKADEESYYALISDAINSIE